MRRLLLALVLVLALAGPAAAASAPGPQALADRTEAWLQGELGVAPLHRPLGLATDADLETCRGVAYMADRGACAAFADADRIDMDMPLLVALWKASGAAPGPVIEIDGGAVQILLHELLHRGHGFDLLEEGLVDSLAYDLLPAAGHAVLGVTLSPLRPSYGPEVHLVRKASALACGTPWRSRCARGLRRAWWAADNATRHAAIAAAIGGAS